MLCVGVLKKSGTEDYFWTNPPKNIQLKNGEIVVAMQLRGGKKTKKEKKMDMRLSSFINLRYSALAELETDFKHLNDNNLEE